jgi:23S rRNA (uracil747-C5)-methyltransferase
MQCEFFDHAKCRSCRWLDRPYAEQLTAKNTGLHALLDRFRPQTWHEPVASAQQGFRNKAKMAVLGTAQLPVLGIVNSRGGEISLCDCPLYPADMQVVLHRLQDWIRLAQLIPYDVARRQGELKFVLLTRSQLNGAYMLRLVLRSEQAIAQIRQQLPALLAASPGIRVVSVNIQPVHMAILEGEKEIFLSDEKHLAERLNDVPLSIRPKSFFQTNPAVAGLLYATAREWTARLHATGIWDVFCGVGGFGLHCATRDTLLTGIEIEPEAIACARQSAAELGLTQARFMALDSAGLAAQAGDTPDLVILNPPRRGIGQSLCAQLAALAPPHILYSSCNPESLAEDLSRLDDYRLMQVQLFDMFPHTPHYEVLTLLSRNTP